MKTLNFMPHQEDALNRTEQFNRCALDRLQLTGQIF